MSMTKQQKVDLATKLEAAILVEDHDALTGIVVDTIVAIHPKYGPFIGLAQLLVSRALGSVGARADGKSRPWWMFWA